MLKLKKPCQREKELFSFAVASPPLEIKVMHLIVKAESVLLHSYSLALAIERETCQHGSVCGLV